MINTRLSIFKSLQKKLKELTRHGKMDPLGFKTILYAVILNDMKEWSEYIPNEDNSKLVDILNEYILLHSDMQIERFIDNAELYKNVNTPQDNTTWSRIWDNKDVWTYSPNTDPLCEQSFTLDSNTETLNLYTECESDDRVPTYSEDDETLTTNLHDKTLFEG